VFVIDGKDHDQQHNDDRMERLEAKLHFEYQKLNSILEFRILVVGSVETLHHRNAKMQKCETPKYQTVDMTPFRSFGYWELEVSKHFITRNAKTPKYWTVDMTQFWSFGYQELEVSKHFITEMSKRRNVK
jgi:hypothetical protein